MKNNRILVTGAGGMVGSYVDDVFSDHDLYLTDVVAMDKDCASLDVCDPGAVMDAVKNIKPDLVLHLAAATDVDRCQLEPDWAHTVNSIGTQNVALACQSTNALLVYVSTGNVFSGDKKIEYTEFDEPGPMNVYGESKLVGEQIVKSLLNRYYIVRAGWMIGGGEKDKKFVGKIARMIVEGNSSLKAVNDKYGSPTYARDLLNGISKLVDTGYYGLYHMVNPGIVSRYQISEVLRDVLEYPDLAIESVSSDHFPSAAPRIRMEALRNYKLELLGCNWMRPWEEALKDYVVNELIPVLS